MAGKVLRDKQTEARPSVIRANLVVQSRDLVVKQDGRLRLNVSGLTEK
jgi:hypothetical protein